jgi:protein SCO1/2
VTIVAAKRPSAMSHPIFWSGLGGLVVALMFVWRVAHPPVVPLPVFSTLPAMNLLDQDGRPYTNDRLRGHVTIANFIFTTCPSVCPLLSQRMAALQDRLPGMPGVQLVSFSVDPETDTPAVLKEYGARYHAQPARWTFVTGQPDAVVAAISDGFKIALTREKKPPPADSPDGFAIVHGENFVLVDGAGRIRGYYHKDDGDLDRLLKDARRLSREGGP